MGGAKVPLLNQQIMRLDAYDKFPTGMREYLKAYGWHFSKAMCDFAVSRMWTVDDSGDKKETRSYTKEDVDKILKQYGVKLSKSEGYDYVYVANMCLFDFQSRFPLNEQGLARYIKAVIDDPDGYDGMVFTRYYADCIGSGTPIIWEEMM